MINEILWHFDEYFDFDDGSSTRPARPLLGQARFWIPFNIRDAEFVGSESFLSSYNPFFPYPRKSDP